MARVLYHRVQWRTKVHWVWCKGHSGHPANERASCRYKYSCSSSRPATRPSSSRCNLPHQLRLVGRAIIYLWLYAVNVAERSTIPCRGQRSTTHHPPGRPPVEARQPHLHPCKEDRPLYQAAIVRPSWPSELTHCSVLSTGGRTPPTSREHWQVGSHVRRAYVL